MQEPAHASTCWRPLNAHQLQELHCWLRLLLFDLLHYLAQAGIFTNPEYATVMTIAIGQQMAMTGPFITLVSDDPILGFGWQQKRERSGQLWLAAFSCVCQFCSQDGYLVRDWVAPLSPRVAAALLRAAEEHSW